MIRLRTRLVLLLLICAQQPLRAQSFNSWQTDLTRQQSYTLKRASSADTTGGNADFRPIEPGKTLTLLDADGPGVRVSAGRVRARRAFQSVALLPGEIRLPGVERLRPQRLLPANKKQKNQSHAKSNHRISLSGFHSGSRVDSVPK